MIKPIIIQKVCELRKHFDCPIIGLGGVTTWQDAIEMSMAGANLIGICSVVILKGVGVIRQLEQGVDAYLARHEKADLSAITSMTQKYLPDVDQMGSYEMSVEETGCTGCKRCVKVCPYEARTFEVGQMEVDKEKCRACGLCVSLCKYLTYSYT